MKRRVEVEREKKRKGHSFPISGGGSARYQEKRIKKAMMSP